MIITRGILQRNDVLRLTAVTALAVCAIMTANHLHPDRAFCPMHGACAEATASALGSFQGIPTSVLGLFAFGGLFVLTLLPPHWAHRFIQPAGVAALAAALVFVGYQLWVLKAFCTLCLVVDALGFVAGATALTWPPPAAHAWGGRIPGHGVGARVLWSSLAMLAVALPLGWSRDTSKGWVEIEPVSATSLGLHEESSGDPILHLAATLDARSRTPKPIHTEAAGSEQDGSKDRPDPAAPPEPLRPLAEAELEASPAVNLGVITVEPRLLGTAAPAPEPEDPTPKRVEAVPPVVKEPPKPSPAPRPRRAAVLIVEYVNAYCAHCRATHARLEHVLRTTEVPVRRVRVYAWSTRNYPLWARACAYAEATGEGDRLFEELVRTSSPQATHVFAAARRAGMDVSALRMALQDPRPPRRLVRDRKLVKRARLRVLPTLDIGRRRLLGEQSEAELRAAIQAACQGAGADSSS